MQDQAFSLSESVQQGVSFESGDFQLLGKGQFHPTQVNTMPVVHYVEGMAHPLGTCFVVGNEGIAITARHVIEEAFGRYISEGATNVVIPPEERLCAIYCSNDFDSVTGHFIGGPLPIAKIWFNRGFDIAVLQLLVPTDVTTGNRLYLPAAQLSPGLPKAGEYIFGFGYHSMKWGSEEDRVLVHQHYAASRGLVQEIHFPKRDSFFLPFPCFQTTARFDGGMSGGPIISQSGQVCGVICSSIKTDESDGSFTSYGSLIAPALALILTGRDSGGVEREMFLHDFVRDGAVPVDHTYKDISVKNTGKEIFVDLGGGRTFQNRIPHRVG